MFSDLKKCEKVGQICLVLPYATIRYLSFNSVQNFHCILFVKNLRFYDVNFTRKRRVWLFTALWNETDLGYRTASEHYYIYIYNKEIEITA